MVSPDHHQSFFHAKEGILNAQQSFFLCLDLILTALDVSQICFLSFSKWQVAPNSSLSFVSKRSGGIPFFPFCNVPAVVISRAKSQLSDSILMHRWSVETILHLIN